MKHKWILSALFISTMMVKPLTAFAMEEPEDKKFHQARPSAKEEDQELQEDMMSLQVAHLSDNQNADFAKLSEEVIYAIVDYLTDPLDFQAFQRTCKIFYRISLDPRLHLGDDFGTITSRLKKFMSDDQKTIDLDGLFIRLTRTPRKMDKLAAICRPYLNQMGIDFFSSQEDVTDEKFKDFLRGWQIPALTLWLLECMGNQKIKKFRDTLKFLAQAKGLEQFEVWKSQPCLHFLPAKPHALPPYMPALQAHLFDCYKLMYTFFRFERKWQAAFSEKDFMGYSEEGGGRSRFENYLKQITGAQGFAMVGFNNPELQKKLAFFPQEELKIFEETFLQLQQILNRKKAKILLEKSPNPDLIREKSKIVDALHVTLDHMDAFIESSAHLAQTQTERDNLYVRLASFYESVADDISIKEILNRMAWQAPASADIIQNCAHTAHDWEKKAKEADNQADKRKYGLTALVFYKMIGERSDAERILKLLQDNLNAA